ncbi:hypothetical protein IQ209_02135 [Xenorhabdus sp. BG5]|nr:hypothetical protein [Xenorhabdus sp. BG5]MBE8595348.1 hypothetical protein [Xenorhabdus sp. BG5]
MVLCHQPYWIPKVTIEITRAAAEEFTIPFYTVPGEMLADFVTDKIITALQEMSFPEADIDVFITDD